MRKTACLTDTLLQKSGHTPEQLTKLKWVESGLSPGASGGMESPLGSVAAQCRTRLDLAGLLDQKFYARDQTIRKLASFADFQVRALEVASPVMRSDSQRSRALRFTRRLLARSGPEGGTVRDGSPASYNICVNIVEKQMYVALVNFDIAQNLFRTIGHWIPFIISYLSDLTENPANLFHDIGLI